MFNLYLFATIFSIAIMATEFFMSFAGNSDSSNENSLEHGSDSAEGEGHEGEGHEGEGHEGEGHEHNNLVANEHNNAQIDVSKHDFNQNDDSSAIKFLVKSIVYLRTIIYFSLGFGVTGLVATFLAETAIATFVWALGLGVATVATYKISNKILRQELDSTIKEEELLLRNAFVIIPVKQGQLGKVEIEVNNQTVERYCRALKPSEEFKRGDKVLVAKVTDDCVYIENSNLYIGGK